MNISTKLKLILLSVAFSFLYLSGSVMAQSAPVVTDIPDQTIAEGATFTTIDLDSYVSDADNIDADLTWTYSGNTDLTVDITARVATITIPTIEWNGNETITFTATDPGSLSDNDAATFTVTSVNDAPVMTDIPDQTIAEGATFTTIDLDSYVSDADDIDADLTWTYSGNTDLTVDITARVATITIPTIEWNGNETITFTATDPGSLSDNDAATFTVTAVNDAPVMTDIPDQTIAEGATFTTIDLDSYVSDADDIDADLTWTYSGNTDLTVDITARVATITIPTIEWNGNETITFTATDPGSLSDNDAATFTVTAVNDAPVMTDIPDQTIAEGATFTTIDLDSYVSDADNIDADLTWTYSGNTDLTVDITARVATITIPTIEWNGNETITFTATDPGSLSDNDAATFTVTAVNDAPVMTDIPDQTIAEGATFTTIDLDSYVSDADNIDADLTWTYSGNTDLTVDITARVATITIPTIVWNGNETITFTATDPGSLSDNDAATFTVTSVNDAPVMTDIPDQTIAEGATFTTIDLDSYVSDADDIDADLTWTYSGNTDLTVDITARVATITIPTIEWNGNETITFTATDPGSLSDNDAATFTVTAVNDAPVMTDIPDQTIAEGATFTTIDLDSYVSDADDIDADLTWTYSGNTDLTVDITARVATITIPTIEWNGNETITFTATDPGSLSDNDAATFTVTAVNDAPVMTDIPDQTIAEGATFTTIDLDSYVSDADNIDADLTWTYSGNTDLTVDITARVATITIPTIVWNGNETITFTATDPGSLSDNDAATFTVTAVNDAPVMTDIPDQTIAEGATFTTIDLDSYVSDADNIDADLTWTYSGNTDLTVDITARVATITIPTIVWNGNETITFTATDPGSLSDNDAATFTVTSVNDAPVMTDIPDQTIAEGATFTTIDLDSYVSDADDIDADLTWTYSGNTDLTVDITARVATITIPTIEWNGNETITFTATDPGSLSDNDAATFTVTAVNDAPVMTDIPDQTIAEGATFTTIDLDSYVSDADDIDADLTWTYSGNTDLTVDITARVATITIPTIEWNGNETITFTATDPGSLSDNDAATFTVTAVNDAPVMTDIPDQTIAEGATFTTIDLDSYVSDADDIDADLTWTYSGNTDLTVDITARVATITIPTIVWNGNETITFTATDPGSLSDNDAATFTVTAVNDAPVLDPIGSKTVVENSNLNFIVTASDPDGTTPVLSAANLPTNATFDDLTGVFDFNPDFSQDGIHYVTFYADDGTEIDSEIVEITVTDVGNQAPVLDPIGTQTVYENSNLNLTITASDPDGSTPTLSVTGIPANATFDALTGIFDFNPDFDQEGVYNLIFKAFDGVLVDSEVVAITVLNSNRLPVLDPITTPQATTEGVNLSFTVTASDPDGNAPSLSAAPLMANATFDAMTGIFDFTPGFAQAGSHDIYFYAGDGIDTDSQLVTINVADAGNQAPVLDPIGALFVIEGTNLNVQVTANDPDGATVSFSAINVPVNATFDDNNDGTATFDFNPDFTQAGVYGVTFITSDGVLADSEFVLVSVTELGNQSPILDPIVSPQTLYENDTISIGLSATDPDSDAILFSFTSSRHLANATIADNLDGTGTFTYITDYLSAGVDTVRIFATDDGTPQLSDVAIFEIITLEVNQPPAIDSIGPFGVTSGKTLQFTVTASDGTSDGLGAVYLTASGIPANASFVDQGDNTGQFTFTPSSSQAGVITVRFIAVDDGAPPMSASIDVEITVVEDNAPPEFDKIMPQMIFEGEVLTLTISVTDPDGGFPELSAASLPALSSFTDNLDGTGTFIFSPSYTMSGLYAAELRAFDGFDNAKIIILIQVIEAGNQIPALNPVPPQSDTENVSITFSVSAVDPDETTPTLSAGLLPDGAVFTDNGDGTGSFEWIPDFTQAGIYDILIIASDENLSDTITVTVTVIDAGNQPPILAPIPDVRTNESNTIRIRVTSTDLDMVVPILTTSALPGSATFTDNGDFTGRFDWVTTYTDAGIYSVTFTATDATDPTLISSVVVQIEVLDANQAPYLLEMPPGQNKTVDEGGTLVYTLSGYDSDGVVPRMAMAPFVLNFDFVDNSNGTATLTVTPSYLQSGIYAITFYAYDGDTANYPDDNGTFGPINFTVTDVPVAPALDPIGPQTVTEGDTLDISINATHLGGEIPQITVSNNPSNSTLLFGTTMPRTFRFLPDYVQAGTYNISIIANQDGFVDTEFVAITVNEAGNQSPYFVSQPDTQSVLIGSVIDNRVESADPENDPIVLSALTLPANATFVDSSNGAGSLRFVPDASQDGATYIFRMVATDPSGLSDTLFKWIRVSTFLRGDANSDGTVNIADVSYIVNYIFRQGDPPDVLEAADVNNDGINEPKINIGDALYLVNFIFRHGPPPVED